MPTTYLALGFITPAFMWAGLALVSIPILIHILNRQRFRVVDWAAMDFLLRAMRKNRKRMKLEQWVLLATRCCVVALIGLALARPLGGYSGASVAAGLSGRAGMNVFVIDNSYSAAYESPHAPVKGIDGQPQPPAKTHLDQQKQMAKLLIDTFGGGGESIAIITAAKPETVEGGSAPSPNAASTAGGPPVDKSVVRRLVLRPGYDLTAAKQFIDRIEQSYAGTDLAGALQLANEFADEAKSAPVKNLYVFSDGTRSAWEGTQADALKRIGPELARRFRVTHFNMTDGRQQWNHAAVDLRPGGNLVTTRFESDLVYAARAFGTGPADPSAQLFVGDQKLGAEQTIKPETQANLQTQKLMPEQVKVGGPRLFTAVLNPGRTGDPLKLDDRRYRVVDVAAEVKVLVVEGQVSDRFAESSGAFLKSALAPTLEDSGVLTAGPRSKTHVTATLASESDLKDRPLRDYRAVILCGVERLDERAADALAAFVRDGGSLVTFLGERVQTENYNTVLLSRGLIPGRLIEKDDRRGTTGGYVFDYKPKQRAVHRYLESFTAFQNTGLETARISTFWKADVSGNPAVERVLNYEPAPSDGPQKEATGAAAARPLDTSRPPAITSHPLGQGVVVFVSTTASPAVDRGWHNLTAKGTWVWLLHEMLAGAVSARDSWMNLQAGQPLVIPSYVEVSSPKLVDENKVPVAIDAVTESGKPPVYRSRPLARPGVYSLELKPNVTVPVAVNVAAAEEADVRTVGNEFVRQALGDIQMTLLGDELPLEQIMSAKEGNDWAGAILVALLALLAIETFMAMRFGHYRHRAEAVRGTPAPA